jgi:hypothetical protein
MLDWTKYIAVAERFQHKAKAQDREDLKQSIVLRLAQVASNNGHKPFTEATMCRIASYLVADYWRSQYRLNNGLDCGSCSRTQRQKCRKNWQYTECPKAVKLEYLSKPIIDENGNITELGELIADDKAIDLDAWLDAKTFLLGFPKRLMEIAHKIDKGDALTNKDHQYLWRFRHREQKRLIEAVRI